MISDTQPSCYIRHSGEDEQTNVKRCHWTNIKKDLNYSSISSLSSYLSEISGTPYRVSSNWLQNADTAFCNQSDNIRKFKGKTKKNPILSKIRTLWHLTTGLISWGFRFQCMYRNECKMIREISVLNFNKSKIGHNHESGSNWKTLTSDFLIHDKLNVSICLPRCLTHQHT